MSSESINRKTVQFALKLKSIRNYPAAVVGAEHKKFKAVASSGLCDSNIMVKSLKIRLKTIGNLYENFNGNTLGCCAEVNAGNRILIKKPFLDLDQINFSRALRPRTMQNIPMCRNCILTFT